MNIPRHDLDEELARAYFRDSVEVIPSMIEGVVDNASNLVFLLSEARRLAAAACVVDPKASEVAYGLRLAAQTATAIFAGSSDSNPVVVELGDKWVTLKSSPSAGSVTPYEWILAFYLNSLCGRASEIVRLCELSTDSLRESSTKNPEYRYRYMDAVRSFWANSGDVLGKFMSALDATEPTRSDIVDEDWTLYIDVPQLEVFIYMASRNQEDFTRALIKAVESHKKYWYSRKRNRHRDYRGFISIELTALSFLAANRGLKIEVESPYLALEFFTTAERAG
jgi:Immunity protein 49